MSWLTALRRGRQPATAEKPLRDELLSIERLEERALALAASFTVDPNPRRRARDTFPALRGQRPRAARGLPHAGRRRARRRSSSRRRPNGCSTTSTWSPPRSPTSAGTCRARYYRELPTLASREHAGHARIYAMAVELIRHSDSRLDRQQLMRFLNSYQRVAPLTIGELWAWPSMLKLALIENLRRLADETARRARRAPRRRRLRVASTPTTSGAPARCRAAPTPRSSSSCCIASREYGLRLSAVRSAVDDAPRRAADDRRGRRSAASTSARPPPRSRSRTPSRACASARRSTGSEYVEAVSLVEQVLQRDPGRRLRRAWTSSAATGSGRRSRSWPTPSGEAPGARRAEGGRERAPGRRASGSTGDRAAHVGYHLDRPRAAAISRPTSPIGPALRTRAPPRSCSRHATGRLPRRDRAR